MGVPNITSGGLRAGDRLWGVSQEETTMAETGLYRGEAEEQYGRGIQGGPTRTSGRGRYRRNMGIVQS